MSIWNHDAATSTLFVVRLGCTIPNFDVPIFVLLLQNHFSSRIKNPINHTVFVRVLHFCCQWPKNAWNHLKRLVFLRLSSGVRKSMINLWILSTKKEKPQKALSKSMYMSKLTGNATKWWKVRTGKKTESKGSLVCIPVISFVMCFVKEKCEKYFVSYTCHKKIARCLTHLFVLISIN